MGNDAREESSGAENGHNKHEIVLQLYLHCQECVKPIVKCLKGFEGVEQVNTNFKDHKVTIKSNKDVDPIKLAERLEKKFNKQVQIISPKLKEERVTEEKKIEPKTIQVTLSIYVHCENCGKKIKQNMEKMGGVQLVDVDAKNSQAIIKGEFKPQNLLDYVEKKMGKQAIIVKVEKQRGHNNEKQQSFKNENNNDDNNKRAREIIPFNKIIFKQYESNCLLQIDILSDENTQACIIM
ncbi:unnamed protein product [Amaranthus hypochondriacus]